MTSDISDQTTSSLENLRKRLLDISARNRLLNFRHTKTASLRAVDELPDQLVEMLLSDTEMSFEAVPEPSRKDLIEAGYIVVDEETQLEKRIKKDPSAAEWARLIGYDMSYEVPENDADDSDVNHADSEIQTLFYPYELETRLRGLCQKAKTAIEETGSNILYLVLGFLEWHDRDKTYIAPLFLFPVQLEKGKISSLTRTYQYKLSYSGEDILPNLSLREKLAIDFNVALPALDEDTLPDAYFETVREVLAVEKPNWKVHRNITLTLLNFSKLLMYLDLDPNRWPEQHNILNHPIVAKFLSGYDENGSDETEYTDTGFSEEYEIDNIEHIHQNYPLIEDADSSQHSALIDVVNGKNLVIEGPPGTGKSQTITNLIAALLAQKKRVLFVAEKLAALEVVKQRLDASGLGEFCLELHSHKTQKRKMIADIANRIERYGLHRSPVDINADIDRYEDLKTKLKDYVECVNQPFKNTGKTVHEVLMAATRYRQQINISPELLHPENVTGENFNSSKQREIQDQVEIFAEGYAASALATQDNSSLPSHPWYGVNNTDIHIFDFELIQRLLLDWDNSLKEIAKITKKVCKFLPTLSESGDLKSVADVEELLSDLNKLPALTGEEVIEALPSLRGETLPKFKKYIALHGEIQALYSKLAQNIDTALLEDLTFVDSIGGAITTFESILKPQSDITPSEIITRLEQLSLDIDTVKIAKDEISNHISSDLRSLICFSEAGIEEYKTFITISAALKPKYWKFRDDLFDNDELDEVLPLLRKNLEAANELEANLKEHFRVEHLPHKQHLLDLKQSLASGGFFKIFNSNWKSAKKEVCNYALNPKSKLSVLESGLDDLIEFVDLKETILENGELKTLLKEHFDGLSTDIETISEIREWYRTVRLHYGVGFGPKVMLGDTVLNLPALIGRAVRSLYESDYVGQLDVVSEHFAFLKSALRNFGDSSTEIIGSDGGLLVDLQEKLNTALADCKPLVADGEFSLSNVLQQIYDLQDLRCKVVSWEKADHDRVLFGGRLGLQVGVGVDNIAGLNTANRTIAVAEVLGSDLSGTTIADKILGSPSVNTFQNMVKLKKMLTVLSDNQQSSYSAYAQKVNLNLDEWTSFGGGTINELLSKNARALEHERALQTYLDYIRTRSYLVQIGYSSLAEVVERGDLDSDDILNGFSAGTYDLLAREIFREIPELARFSGFNQNALRKQFSTYDQKLKKLQREEIAAKVDTVSVPRGGGGGRVSQYSGLFLLEHECGKKTRHIPIRQLVRRAGDALLALKPCFMMGPMSAAQYLEPGKFQFDVIVMDEASQIKPEDALGTIARGKQLVVVGDPKQLPPTNFFNRLIKEDDDDPTGLEESESILDATLPIFDSRRLRWHYRSQHESLIAFSNHSFYNNNLVLFPSPNSESELFGIKYHKLNRGCFAGRRNNREAEAITEELKKHFLNHADTTIGIVTMSAEQRDQVERAIDQASKEDSLLRQLLEKDTLRSESLFIKNLENVQGDERDVILISMTYGPADVGGKVYQRFGPINSEVGWRRLNVLFTRSRKRMHIFSSMNSSDIVVHGSSSLGVKALRDFLAYCESGRLSQTISETGRPPDSDFEISVMEALGQHGFECVPQVGVAGFFIDIAVRDPGNPGSYLMGVECDGATYHSAKSVRDRDRLRQAVLERLGWNIRRIWSTDWFKNPDSQIQPIIDELNELKTVALPVVEETFSADDVVSEYSKEDTKHEPSVDSDKPVERKKPVQQLLFQAVDKIASEETSLRDKLLKYDTEVILKENGDIPDDQKLLRPAMLDAFIEHLPTSKSEFLEVIPFYLRTETATGQGEYLTGVLDIISADFE